MPEPSKAGILADDELRRRIQELEQRVVECTLALRESEAARLQAQEQLGHAQRVATVSRLTGCIAHDFNNLLTVILGNLELALIDLPDDQEKLEKLLVSAQQAGSRGVELVNRLLAFSRKQTLRPKIVDINEVVADLARLLPRILGENIEIEVLPDQGPLHAMLDPAQLESALLNLAVNSCDAMPEGGKLTIRCSRLCLDERNARPHPDAEPGEYVQVAVSDTGAGMSADVAAQAFEPFYTTKSLGNGSGLGLCTVHGFVRQSGGFVRLESTPGQGTLVELNLPSPRGRRHASTQQQTLEIGGNGRRIDSDR